MQPHGNSALSSSGGGPRAPAAAAATGRHVRGKGIRQGPASGPQLLHSSLASLVAPILATATQQLAAAQAGWEETRERGSSEEVAAAEVAIEAMKGLL